MNITIENFRKHPADFSQLEMVLNKEKPDRPVLFEYFMNAGLISAINSISFADITDPLEQIKSIISFFYRCGYDYATIPGRYFSPLSFSYQPQLKKETISQNIGAGIIDWKSFEKYSWPDPQEGNYELLSHAGRELIDGMKFVIPGPGGLLENVTDLMGFENLCYLVFENEELVKSVFDETGIRLLQYYETCSSIPSVGALIVNDDWGFKTQTILSPEMLRQFVFPWHKKIVEAIHKNGKYAILHSCGNIFDVMDDIISDMKYDAKHSFEDTILPVEEAYPLWHEKIAILGGIDVDFLARETPGKIGERCRRMIDVTGNKSYALGSGNSIPSYVPAENYLAMIRVAFE